MSYGTEANDGSITLGMLGGTYLSPYIGYSGTGTESLGTAAGSFMGSIVMAMQSDESFKFDDFTAINTQITSDGLNMAILATWAGGTAIPYGTTTAIGTASAISNTQADRALKLRTGNGCIYFDDEVACSVYNISGTLIRSENGSVVSGLGHGIFIVVVNGKATKVAL